MATEQKTRPAHPKHRRAGKGGKPSPRRVAAVVLWAAGIAAGIFGGNYSLLVALTLLVAGFYLFATDRSGKR